MIGLLRNLAQDNENRQLLANHDLVNMLTQLIQSILAPIHQHMQANGGAQPDVGRECALTISQSTNLMGLFAKDPNTINRIRSSQTTMNVMLEVNTNFKFCFYYKKRFSNYARHKQQPVYSSGNCVKSTSKSSIT